MIVFSDDESKHSWAMQATIQRRTALTSTRSATSERLKWLKSLLFVSVLDDYPLNNSVERDRWRP